MERGDPNRGRIISSTQKDTVMKNLFLTLSLVGVSLVACGGADNVAPFPGTLGSDGGSDGSGATAGTSGSQGGNGQSGNTGLMCGAGTVQQGNFCVAAAGGGQGQAGQGQAGSGVGGQGQAGSGQAGQGTAGSGQAGQGTAGSGNAGQGQAGSGNAGSGNTGGSAAGGAPPVNYCVNQASWACNPVGKTLCSGAGSACDLSNKGDLNCFGPPNDAALGAACDVAAGPYCSQGATCVGNICVAYCCTDADCGGGVACGVYPGTASVTVGVCGGQPGGAGGSGAGGGAAGSGAGGGAAGSGAGGSTGGVTWTQIYNDIFGPSGTSSCSVNGGCHTNTKAGFKCGTSKSSCYTGFVNAGYISPGSGASSSALVDPNQSPLCGSLGGNMPQVGSCVTSAQLNEIKSWLADGAQNN
jgi:hypothetical protein